jgi:hypothetical protein
VNIELGAVLRNARAEHAHAHSFRAQQLVHAMHTTL